MTNMEERINEMRDLRTAEDPCPRTTPHMAHRNWRSDDVGVCPGVADTKKSHTGQCGSSSFAATEALVAADHAVHVKAVHTEET